MDNIVTRLTDWHNSLVDNITMLNRYMTFYRIIGGLNVILLAGVVSALGVLESMTLGSEISDSSINNETYSIVKLVLIIVSAILTSINVNINPLKKSNDCYICSKEYSELINQMSRTIDKFSIGYYGSDEEELLRRYNHIVVKYSSKESSILENQPMVRIKKKVL